MLLFPLAPIATARDAPFTVTNGLPTAKLGRVRLYLSTKCSANDAPPRAQCSDDQDSAQVFGVDTPATGLEAGGHVVIDVSTLGYPRHTVRDLPAGGYCVQAELFPYTKFFRGDGANVTLPTSCVSPAGGDGAYGSPPGTLYSDVLNVLVEPGGRVGPVSVALTHEVQPAPSPGCSGKGADTEWIKTVSVESKLLSAFWGTPITLEACVLLPYGFAERPNATYPLLIAHGHYSSVFMPGGRFDDKPPTANLSGYDYVDQQYAYWLYRNCER